MIVEWNPHMFSSDVERYPWHPRAAYIPGRERWLPDPLTTYLHDLDVRGVDRAVIVHPEPYGDDHSLVLDCLAREAERIKTTCLFYPRDPDAVTRMRALVTEHPRIIATRFHAHRGKTTYLESFDAPYVRAMWEAAGDLGLIVELHIGPDYARQAARAIEDYRDIPVLIDHMAEPQSGTTEEYEDVLDLARFPNVHMKMSGLTHFSKEPEPHLDTKSLVNRVASAFGPDRFVWSSGSPGLVDILLDSWSDADRAKVKGETLARFAGFC